MQRTRKNYNPATYFKQRRKKNASSSLSKEPEYSIDKKHESNKPENYTAIEDDKRRDVKWTDVANVFISFLMLGVTGFLFNETYQQRKLTQESTKAAISAANEATRANDHTNYKDSINDIRDSLNAIRQSDKDRASFNLANQSLQAQINSIEETRKRFEIENQPYLQILNPVIVYDHPMNSALINYDIANLKDVPVKMISQKSTVATASSQPKLSELKDFKKKATLNLNVYITKEFAQGKTGTIPLSSTRSSIARLEQPNIYIYFYTEIVYLNLANGKSRIYKYGVKLKHVNSSINTFREVFANENYDL